MDTQLDLPRDFLTVYRRGVLNVRDGVRLSDVRWMTLEHMANYDRPSFLSDRLVPFALTAAGARFGWWKSSGDAGYDYVVFSPHDCEEASVYAPHFTGFLYRIILDDLGDCWGSWLDDNCGSGAVAAMVNRNIELVRPHLPSDWMRVLTDIASREPRSAPSGGPAWMERQEADDITVRAFQMATLNTPIRQYCD